MENDNYQEKMKTIHDNLILFIESEINADEEFQVLTYCIQEKKITENSKKVIDLLMIISKIIKNHHRSKDFLNKIKQVLSFIHQLTSLNPNDIEKIFHIFQDQRQFLILLLKSKIIYFDNSNQSLIRFILKNTDKYGIKYTFYLYPEIKSIISSRKRKKIFMEFSKKYPNYFTYDFKKCREQLKYYEENLNTFQEKCLIGENDSYICSLIRNDSVEDFISHVNKLNLPLTSIINPSIYETNKLFMKPNSTISLIDYAMFYGSIQIIKYPIFSRQQLKFPIE